MSQTFKLERRMGVENSRCLVLDLPACVEDG
jgi:hypothetical protein